jgi:hypothetical protein
VLEALLRVPRDVLPRSVAKLSNEQLRAPAPGASTPRLHFDAHAQRGMCRGVFLS